MPDASRFLDLIREALPDLHPAERRLGAFLLDFPGEMASYDAQELARLAGVSKATVSRFVRRLGFPSYEQARRTAREEARTGSRLYLGHAEAGDFTNLSAQIEEERSNLEWTYRRLSVPALDALSSRILSSRKVWVLGQRISQNFAGYLGWQLMKLAEDVTSIPRAGETLGEYIATMQPEDCVIVFALRRRAAGTDAVIDEILKRGSALALISDEGMATRADVPWHFQCQTGTNGPQFNHSTVLALCHQIMLRTSAAAGPAGRAGLRRAEEINERIGAL